MDTMWLPVLVTDEGPKYLALTRALRDAVRSGELKQGAQLPTVRELAYQLSVTPGTVSRAYQIATQEGLLQATVGRGTFVAAAKPQLGPTQPLFVERDHADGPDLVDLRSPSLPDVDQGRYFAAILAGLATRVGPEWLSYTNQRDEAPLREAVVGWLKPRNLGPVSQQDVMLCHGGQNGVNLVLDCCLRGDRPVVLIEDLAYPGFRYAARAARAEVVTIELDNEGIRPDALEAACRRHGAQVLCLTPSAQNPTAARMSRERQADILAIAQKYDLQIIEDECYSVSSSDQPTLRSMAPDRVWYTGSLSKSVSAALRFGYVVCPLGMGETGRIAAQHNFFALALPLTLLVSELLQSGAAAEIRAKVQSEFDARLDMLVAHMGGFDLTWQSGIPFAWLRLPQGWRAYTFTRMAEEQGVLLRAADQYATSTGRAPNAVRLAIAGDIPRQHLASGLATLAHLLPRPPNDMAV